MKIRLILPGVLLLCLAGSASAGPVIYDVTIDTSSGPYGYFGFGSVDFNFNPGPAASQAASIQILNFTSGASINTPYTAGDVSGGPLPMPVTIGNGSGFNDYYEQFLFGDTLSFELSFYGPALSAPDGVSTSGSTFAFSMADPNPVFTSDDTDGFAFLINVNPDGTTSVVNYSAETSIVQLTSAVPEPGTLTGTGMALGLGLVLIMRPFRRRKAFSHPEMNPKTR